MSKILKTLFKQNKANFPDVVWKKEDILKWKKLTTTKEGKDILKLWYKDVHLSTIFPHGIDNTISEEEISVEVEKVLLKYSPPKIRNKKKILAISIVLIIIAAIGIFYGLEYA